MLARTGAPLLGLLSIERRENGESLGGRRLTRRCRCFLEKWDRVIIVEQEEVFVTDEGAWVASVLERVAFGPGWVRT